MVAVEPPAAETRVPAERDLRRSKRHINERLERQAHPVQRVMEDDADQTPQDEGKQVGSRPHGSPPLADITEFFRQLAELDGKVGGQLTPALLTEVAAVVEVGGAVVPPDLQGGKA